MKKRQFTAIFLISVSLLLLAVFASAAALKTGDVNKDGKITADDARLTLRASAMLETLDDEQAAAAEVTGDGRITASDARRILRVSAQLESFTELPDETEPDSEPSDEEPSTEEPELPSYPEEVNAFLRGSFYINGSMEKDGKKSDFIITTNGADMELMPVIEGKTISLFASADKSYLKWQNDAGEKYCIDIASLPVNTEDLNISELLDSLDFATGKNYIYESAEEKETDGRLQMLFTFKNSDGREIVFYTEGENIEAIEIINGDAASKITVKELAGAIPEGFLTTDGYAPGAVHDFVVYIDGVEL